MNSMTDHSVSASSSQFACNSRIALVGREADAPSNWGILRVHGADATDFLQRQLSNDIAHMRMDEARLAAWCSAKGRMIASFIVVRTQPVNETDTYWLLCRRDVMAQTIKKLRLYILRSKVFIEDVSQEIAAYGLLGDSALTLWQACGGTIPFQPWQCLNQRLDKGTRHVISLYPSVVQPGQTPESQTKTAAVPRVLCLQPASLPAPVEGADSAHIAHWEWAEATSGVADIEQACAELFVPQMINYESVDGISFKKGCYPGQEVVARSQFRGAIKRRGYIATAHSSSFNTDLKLAGKEVWLLPVSAAAHAKIHEPQVCGSIVQAACLGEYCALLVSLQISAAEAASTQQASLHIGNERNVPLQLHPLPYAFIEV